ncbi:MAG: phosphotransferase [Woeseiaceae bacterium]
MSEFVADAVAKIPGWESAKYSEITGSLTNRCWLLEADDRKAVLKLDESPRTEPFNSRPAEALVQNRALDLGIANAVLFVNETVLLTEYIEGTVWSEGCLLVDENLDKLAAAMRTLHSMPLTGRTFDAVGAARGYAQRIKEGDPTKVRDCLAKVEAMPLPHNLCCCHNDMVAANVIYSPDVRFLDWEYACDNDPFFDIATVVAHHKLAPDRSRYLLNAYFDGDGERWSSQLARQTEFYDALYWLWAAARLPAVT